MADQLKTHLNEKEAAEISGLSVHFFRQARHKGRGPVYFKVGARVLYRVEDLEAWLNSCRVEPVQKTA